MPEHIPVEWGQGGLDRMHHSSRGAEVDVGPLADVIDQRSTFNVHRPSSKKNARYVPRYFFLTDLIAGFLLKSHLKL